MNGRVEALVSIAKEQLMREFTSQTPDRGQIAFAVRRANTTECDDADVTNATNELCKRMIPA